ncbi:MAG: hypothetical protein EPN17_10425 [Methylobacter sp.]|nr:MAG: hypothetical protein EPN17_10425 [Methylobacter sp.]
MKILIVAPFFLSFVALSGCSIYSAINAPDPINYKAIQLGNDRIDVISILGQPKMSETKNLYATDYFEFIDGNHGGYKARVLPYLAGDIFTLGLAEIIFWPLEKLALEGSLNRAFVTYDLDNKVNEIKVNKKSDGEPLYFSEAPKTIRNLSKVNTSVAIALFNCNCDDIIKESVQDSIMDVFFKSNYGKPIKGNFGDVLVKGTVTMAEGVSNHSEGHSSGSSSMSISPSLYYYGSYGSGYSSSEGHKADSSASGSYLSVITIQAYRNGEMVASESIGQNLGTGELSSPQLMANQAANSILKILVGKNIIER